MQSKENVMFILDEPALVIDENGKRYLVVGDLHIGLEARFRGRGVHVYGLAENMAKKIKRIMNEFGANSLIVLGDVKDSVLYPDSYELRNIKSFFDALKEIEVVVAEGNHDAHLEEITGIRLRKEILLGRYALFHGNAFPTAGAMKRDYLITAHSHVGVTLKDEKGTIYRYKAWMVSSVSKKAGEYYRGYNKKAKLISMPAFNDLILGTGVEQLSKKENLNPLLRNGIFNYSRAEVYLLNGEFAGRVSSLK